MKSENINTGFFVRYFNFCPPQFFLSYIPYCLLFYTYCLLFQLLYSNIPLFLINLWLVVTRVPTVPSLKADLSKILLKNINKICNSVCQKNVELLFTLRWNFMCTDNEHDTHILVHVFFSVAAGRKGPWPPVLRPPSHLDYGKRFIRFKKFRQSLSTAAFHLYLDLISGRFFTFWYALILPSWDTANPWYTP
jgi:hypothetical protein